ncbi:gamma-aminobutyrate transporter [Klebsiella variicola]|uniref:Gamma-aminobutyrate transporter n=1 Tax=Klebsiella variicola TaxID=244366 RepID=A0A7H4ME05_KLEVA|nr:gamma-aminobutyrate transporter [Klebsiella variicola]
MVVNYYAPAKVFKFLIDSSGAIALLVYLVIAVSQLRMRKILQAQGGEIRLRMWLYPYLTWLVIAFITFVLVVMLFRPAQQLGGDLYRPVSIGNYLYGTDYVALEKAGIVAKTAAAKYALTLFPAPAGKSIQE